MASENIVALCDVDAQRLGKAPRSGFPQAKTYADYRKLLDQKRPRRRRRRHARPHARHPGGLGAAARAGRVLRKAAGPLGVRSAADARGWRPSRRPSRRWARRSTPATTTAAWSRSCKPAQIGPIDARARVDGRRHPAGRARRSEGTPPDDVDYDLWIGPAPMRPFHESHFHFNWRYWWDFGGGTLADFGCHYMDLPFWALESAVSDHGRGQGRKDLPGRQRRARQHAGRLPFPGARRPAAGAPDLVSRRVAARGGRGLRQGQRPCCSRARSGRLLADYGTRKLFMLDGTDGRAAAADDSQLDRPLGRMGRGLQDPRADDLQLRLLGRAGRGGAAGQRLVSRGRPKARVGRRAAEGHELPGGRPVHQARIPRGWSLDG